MGSYYIPPVNFGMVEDNLYRSGQPGELNFPFLEKLKLKKILYLSNEDPPSSFQNFVSEQGIEFEPLGSPQYFTFIFQFCESFYYLDRLLVPLRRTRLGQSNI